MKIIKGDLIQLAKSGEFNIILHGCNCQNVMGSGIAKQIKLNFPHVYDADTIAKQNGNNKLGNITITSVDLTSYQIPRILQVINLYTQEFYGNSKNTVYIDYSAVKSCFAKVARLTNRLSDWSELPQKIGYPKIGCGLGNGDWNIVSEIIEEQLIGLDHTLVELE